MEMDGVLVVCDDIVEDGFLFSPFFRVIVVVLGDFEANFFAGFS